MAIYLRNTVTVSRTQSGFARIPTADVGEMWLFALTLV
jgi:hypothetical protein